MQILLNNTNNYIHILKKIHIVTYILKQILMNSHSHANFAKQYLQLYLYIKANL